VRFVASVLSIALGACADRPARSAAAGPVEVAVEPAPADPAPPPDAPTGAPPAPVGDRHGLAARGRPRADRALVDVAAAIPDAVLDLRYASDRNFTGAAIYPVARCLLHEDVAARLAAAAAELRRAGYRLLVWDCYRPQSVQRLLWQRVRDPRYVAEPVDDARGRPASGSIHSRAAAVDVSLADADGVPLPMPTEHDHFGREAHRDHPIADPQVRARVAALDRAMTRARFVGLATEWWHYAAAGAGRYPIRDDPLE
jgi:zinc D-Ala-D-Ala dipeptidase